MTWIYLHIRESESLKIVHVFTWSAFLNPYCMLVSSCFQWVSCLLRASIDGWPYGWTVLHLRASPSVIMYCSEHCGHQSESGGGNERYISERLLLMRCCSTYLVSLLNVKDGTADTADDATCIKCDGSCHRSRGTETLLIHWVYCSCALIWKCRLSVNVWLNAWMGLCSDELKKSGLVWMQWWMFLLRL